MFKKKEKKIKQQKIRVRCEIKLRCKRVFHPLIYLSICEKKTMGYDIGQKRIRGFTLDYKSVAYFCFNIFNINQNLKSKEQILEAQTERRTHAFKTYTNINYMTNFNYHLFSSRLSTNFTRNK